MKNKEALDTLHDIKELMEKSTKFMSIGGVSKCTPSFFMHKTPTFTSRGFVIT